jgi:hypothetical protein
VSAASTNANRNAAAQAKRQAAAAELRSQNAAGDAPADATAPAPHLTVVPNAPRESSGDHRPLGSWENETDAKTAAADGKPAPAKPKAPSKAKTPAAKKASTPKPGHFAKVTMATRIPVLAQWIAKQTTFTLKDAAAAEAPSACSPTVMGYTLPDARLTAALAELGYTMTDDKGTWNVAALVAKPAPRPRARAAKTS